MFFFLAYFTLYNRLQFHPSHQNWFKWILFNGWVTVDSWVTRRLELLSPMQSKKSVFNFTVNPAYLRFYVCRFSQPWVSTYLSKSLHISRPTEFKTLSTIYVLWCSVISDLWSYYCKRFTVLWRLRWYIIISILFYQ